MTWTTSNAASCSASGDWSGSKNKNGGRQGTGSLTSSKTYNISCIGITGDSASDSVSVSVGARPTGNINLRGRVDGSNWNGSVSYRIFGPETLSGNSINSSMEHPNVYTGTWTFAYLSGGPPNSDYLGVNEANSQTLTNGGTITYTLLFSNNQPDLDIVSGPVTNPLDIIRGESVTFRATTKNIGNSSAVNSTIRFILDGATFRNLPQGILAPGESRQIVTDSWTASAGGHTIEVCADIYNNISESNENNNCGAYSFSVEELITECNDGRDNDNDGNIDYPADEGCACGNGLEADCPASPWTPPPKENPECNDGRDNDGDGWIDYPDDKGCLGSWTESEEGSGGTQCSDGADNDDDGLIDGNDPDCSSSSDNTEKALKFDEF
ncbi:hypothetical protein COW82_00135 [Candidatus Campbellbacteria bacterium CG22_combo_CG10-13_8_21_14_all_43_18]|uniref:CARDB domain-containing protein n=1 Tax=Candidatus Campbellbacteria bacterium CG22_combo_CG10-13_8_21_14_all_43_18 TaxID=1974530 RepID=A0A2H0DX84_9BACT|nr:MAG: hypothetical protein COW82_00135 [Candidatus Campbellbacteria bacterium CG22_combo_CG10-13_8_21_14_all_43_18]